MPADWILHADSDEFLREARSLQEIVSEIERENAGYAEAAMIDRFAVGGFLSAIHGLSTVEELDAAFPIRAAVTQHLAQACARKACLNRWPFLGVGHAPDKEISGRRATKRMRLDHFKWRAGLEQRLRKRIGDHARTGVPCGVESERILAELAEFGRIRVEKWLNPPA
jgi:hypothetical protein